MIHPSFEFFSPLTMYKNSCQGHSSVGNIKNAGLL
jgi:hypothetical protein